LPEPPSGLPRLTPLATASVRETVRPLPPKTPKAAPPEEPPEAAEGAAETAAIPPVRVAAITASEPAATPPPAGAGFGVDLGGASNLEALSIHWATLKANYGPLLVGLRPLVALLPKHPNGAIYRLVVGPLPSPDKATQFCAGFPVLPTGCHPAKFSGAQLAAR
jgi:cell division septation protein DedD